MNFTDLTPGEARDFINTLTDRYRYNRNQYRATSYNEETTRQEFINPFFEALGWDVSNRQGFSEAYKDVIHEEGIKIGGERQAPDYTFRIGSQRKFFVEAKRPSVDIKNDPDPALQLRRYAWSAKLPLSAVVSFEAFAAYDTRIRPREKDKASTARLLYLTFDEYIDRFDEIWEVFSKYAVLKGAFDRYAEETSGKRGTSEVDAEFLKEIEGWRENLARNIALRNAGLSVDEMNFAVQQTIDRILFLRIAEGRNVESFEQLRSQTAGTGTYQKLLQLFRQADSKYNSGLFDFTSDRADRLTPRLAIDDRVLKEILEALYYPKSPYAFSVLPAEILGNVYEQFLGKVIRLTGHRARVEEKPEVKKAGGVYYTPSFVVDYIVAQTVKALAEGKSPKEMAKLRVLDPACGSGSFLISAYQALLDAHLAWYQEHGLARQGNAVYRDSGGEWHLTIGERGRILVNSIFGVDIDRQAAEVTKLSLLLKVFEGKGQLTLYGERMLPSLEENIRCGNSLIDNADAHGELFGDEGLSRRVNPFEWHKEFRQIFRLGGFDAVIGNPPYVRPHNIEPDVKAILWRRYRSFVAKSDLYACFIERSLSLIREGGLLSFIVPHTWTSLESFASLRKLILEEARVVSLTQLPHKVFKKATVETCIVLLERRGARAGNGDDQIDVEKLSFNRNVEVVRTFLRSEIEQSHLLNFRLYSDSALNGILRKMDTRGRPLGDLVLFLYGFKTADDEKFIFPDRRNKECRPFIRSGAIHRYWYDTPSEFVWFVPEQMVSNRSTARPGDLARFEAEKLMVARMGKDLAVAYDRGGLFVKDAMLLLEVPGGPPLKYCLGLLNSRLLRCYYRELFVTIDVLKNALLRLPIFVTPAAKEIEALIALVTRMLDHHQSAARVRTPHDQDLLRRQMDRADREINQLVYKLYDLRADEIDLVESSFSADDSYGR